jgi:hypothetical protein
MYWMVSAAVEVPAAAAAAGPAVPLVLCDAAAVLPNRLLRVRVVAPPCSIKAAPTCVAKNSRQQQHMVKYCWTSSKAAPNANVPLATYSFNCMCN